MTDFRERLIAHREAEANKAELAYWSVRRLERKAYAAWCRSSASLARAMGSEYESVAQEDEAFAKEAEQDVLV